MVKYLGKLVTCLLYREEEILQNCIQDLKKNFSALDFQSSPVPFVYTDYYEKEMGKGLTRRLYSFQDLVPLDFLQQAKLLSRNIEEKYSQEGKRKINIDMGTLDFSRFVLASFKEGKQKIYLGQGVWADLTLLMEKTKTVSLPWTFPDYRSGIFDDSLLQIRNLYKQQKKAALASLNSSSMVLKS